MGTSLHNVMSTSCVHGTLSVLSCVCVCKRGTERDREREGHTHTQTVQKKIVEQILACTTKILKQSLSAKSWSHEEICNFAKSQFESHLFEINVGEQVT